MSEILNYLNTNPYLYVVIFVIIILIIFAIVKFRKSIDKSTNYNEIKDLPFDIHELIDAIGGLNNINDVEGSISKVTFDVKDNGIVNLDEINKLGASGIVETSKGFTFIFGMISKTIASTIKTELEKK